MLATFYEIEVIINSIFLIYLRRYYKRKSQLLKSQTNKASSAPSKTFKLLKKVDLANAKIAMLMCLFSSITHIFSFFVLIIFFTFGSVYSLYGVMSIFVAMLVSFRNAFNILIYLKLNKKFSGAFWKLIKCGNLKKTSVPVST